MLYDLEGISHLKTIMFGKLLFQKCYKYSVYVFIFVNQKCNSMTAAVRPTWAPRTILLFVEHRKNICRRDFSVGRGTDGRTTPTQITDY